MTTPAKPFQETSELLKPATGSTKWWLLGKNSTDFDTTFDAEYPTLVTASKTKIIADQKTFADACADLEIKDLATQKNEEDALKLLNAAIDHAQKKLFNTLIGFAESKKLESAINILKEFGTAFELPLEVLAADAKIDTAPLMKPPKIPVKKFLEDCTKEIEKFLPSSVSKYHVESNDKNPDAEDINEGSKIYETLDGKKTEVATITPKEITLKGTKHYDMARLAVALLKSSGVPLDKELKITATPKEFLDMLLKELPAAGYKNVKEVKKSPETSPKPDNPTSVKP